MTGRTAGAGLGIGTEGFENCRDLLRTAVSHDHQPCRAGRDRASIGLAKRWALENQSGSPLSPSFIEV